MLYHNFLISRPIRFDETYIQKIKGGGDSYFLTAVEYTPSINLNNIPPKPDVMVTTKPHVRFEYLGDKLLCHGTEGGTLDVNLTLSEPPTTDTNVTVDLVFGRSEVPEVLIADDHYVDYSNVPVNWNSVVEASEASDFTTVTGVASFLQGETSSSVAFETVDDLAITANLKVCEVTISAIDNVDYQIHPVLNNGYLVFNEVSTIPKWEGSLEVWCRTHKLSHLERVLDPDTSSVSGFNFGWELNADGTLSDVSTLASIQIDDIPLEEIVIKPTSTDGVPDLPVDIESETIGGTPIDLSTSIPYYRLVIFLGRRQ